MFTGVRLELGASLVWAIISFINHNRLADCGDPWTIRPVKARTDRGSGNLQPPTVRRNTRTKV